MHKEAARHTKRRTTRGQPANRAALHQNRDRPANRKARNRNRDWPASPSPLPTSTPSRKPAPHKRSENHQISWRIARPNAGVVVSAMYENDQTLPLPSMYGKNLIFKTGGVDATGLEEPLSLIEQGLIDTSCLISKRYALNDILEAYRAFEAREDGCLKVVITPWENAKTPQPKRRQEGHDKSPDYPHESRTLQPIGDKSEKNGPPAQQILDLATSNARIKTMGPAKCS